MNWITQILGLFIHRVGMQTLLCHTSAFIIFFIFLFPCSDAWIYQCSDRCQFDGCFFFGWNFLFANFVLVWILPQCNRFSVKIDETKVNNPILFDIDNKTRCHECGLFLFSLLISCVTFFPSWKCRNNYCYQIFCVVNVCRN